MVLRCQDESTGIFDTWDTPLMQAAVCTKHRSELEAGEPWAYGDIGSQESRLLMHGDLPPVISAWGMQGQAGPGKTLKLVIDGEEKDFWIKRELADELGRALKREPPV